MCTTAVNLLNQGKYIPCANRGPRRQPLLDSASLYHYSITPYLAIFKINLLRLHSYIVAFEFLTSILTAELSIRVIRVHPCVTEQCHHVTARYDSRVGILERFSFLRATSYLDLIIRLRLFIIALPSVQVSLLDPRSHVKPSQLREYTLCYE
jgi:hypothetical protein